MHQIGSLNVAYNMYLDEHNYDRSFDNTELLTFGEGDIKIVSQESDVPQVGEGIITFENQE